MPGKRPRSERSDRNRLGLRSSRSFADELPHAPSDASLKILRPREVIAKIGLSSMQLWRLRKANRFPKPVRLGSNSVGYLEHEVDEWIRQRAAEREAPFGDTQLELVFP